MQLFLVSCTVFGITRAVPYGGAYPGAYDHATSGPVTPELPAGSEDPSIPAVQGRKCKLERAESATSSECFLEPECKNICQEETAEVTINSNHLTAHSPKLVCRCAPHIKTRNARRLMSKAAKLPTRRSARLRSQQNTTMSVRQSTNRNAGML